MTISLDDDLESDIICNFNPQQDPTPPRDPFLFGGREVNQETVINSTDEKTRWLSKSMMQRGGGSVEAGVHISTGPGKGIEITGYAQGNYSDNNGNYVKINADIDKKGNSDIDISSGRKFGKNNGQ
jgi:hypothetical protein